MNPNNIKIFFGFYIIANVFWVITTLYTVIKYYRTKPQVGLPTYYFYPEENTIITGFNKTLFMSNTMLALLFGSMAIATFL